MSDILISRLIRSRRRSIALIVTPQATLTVRAPLHTPLVLIENLIRKKADWILRRIEEVRGRPRASAWSFEEGSGFLFLGRDHPLRFFDGDRITLGEELLFPREFLARAEEEMIFWYKQNAFRLIQERVGVYARIMDLRPAAVRLSRATRRWASCSASGEVHFNWRLIMVPLGVLDYVVVHELAHLAVRDHSARFWRKVAEYYPDHRSCRRWLKENQERIIPS
jgi:predicted metal-dependent hydrolase